MMGGRRVQRLVTLLVLWTFVCYGLFQLTTLNDAGAYISVSSRLLLQKVTDPATAQPDAGAETPSSAAVSGDVVVDDPWPSVDQRQSPSEQELAQTIQKGVPNVPLAYWVKEKSKISSKNHTCAVYPSVLDIKFNNDYWQTVRTSNGTFYLYGAYYDDRANNKLGPTVRILGMIDRIEPTVKSYCLLWYDVAKDPVKTPVLEYKYVWFKKWGNYKQGLLQPYLLACRVPHDLPGRVPISVSVTEKGCEPATTNLRVHNRRPEPGQAKGQFAVCVKGLDFLQSDLSVRLVEWIELLTLLGADKIFFYELEVHANISKVLRHYADEGRIEVTRITLPGEQPNIPGLRHMYLKSKVTSKRQNEVIPYNDCLYRNLYTYRYIALMDTDEVIMPKNVQTWSELIGEVVARSGPGKASYNFRNVYFWDDEQHSHRWEPTIPRHLHMLQHVYRSANYTKPNQYVKCFHDVERILTLHNHFPLACLNGSCTSYAVDPETAHLQHYRSDCVSTLKKSCDAEYKQHLVKDSIIWRYKDRLVPRVQHVLRKLGFFAPRTSAVSLDNGPVVPKDHGNPNW